MDADESNLLKKWISTAFKGIVIKPSRVSRYQDWNGCLAEGATDKYPMIANDQTSEPRRTQKSSADCECM
jgi:hypothetical protein